MLVDINIFVNWFFPVPVFGSALSRVCWMPGWCRQELPDTQAPFDFAQGKLSTPLKNVRLPGTIFAIEICAFPPLRQEKIARMGHGAFIAGRARRSTQA